MVTLEIIREIFADLPEVEEGYPYGTRAFKVKKKLLGVFIKKKTPWWLKRISMSVRNLLQANPVTYYITDPYTNQPLVLVRLPTVQRHELRKLLIKAWRKEAPKKLVEEFDSK